MVIDDLEITNGKNSKTLTEKKVKLGDTFEITKTDGNCFNVGDIIKVYDIDEDGAIRFKTKSSNSSYFLIDGDEFESALTWVKYNTTGAFFKALQEGKKLYNTEWSLRGNPYLEEVEGIINYNNGSTSTTAKLGQMRKSGDWLEHIEKTELTIGEIEAKLGYPIKVIKN